MSTKTQGLIPQSVLLTFFILFSGCGFDEPFGPKEGSLLMRLCIEPFNEYTDPDTRFEATVRLGSEKSEIFFAHGLEEGKLCGNVSYIPNRSLYTTTLPNYPSNLPLTVLMYEYDKVGNLLPRGGTLVKSHGEGWDREFLPNFTEQEIPVIRLPSANIDETGVDFEIVCPEK